MQPRRNVPEPLADLARLQANVVYREQALALGLTRSVVDRLLDQQLWHRLAPGVYHLVAIPPPWTALVWAGVLIGGDQALAAGFSAGKLWGLVTDPPNPIQILVPYRRVVAPQYGWQFTRTRHLPVAYGDPPRTPLAETVLDLCALDQSAPPSGSTRHCAIPASRPERSSTPWPDARATRNASSSPPCWMTTLRASSELEQRRYARLVERAHRLPRHSASGTPGARYRVDVRARLLIVELDGHLGHDGAGRFRDMERDNATCSKDG